MMPVMRTVGIELVVWRCTPSGKYMIHSALLNISIVFFGSHIKFAALYFHSNSCGQLGQSYQDYHCSEEEKHMECPVDPEMTITAVTHAKWWGAPGPLTCGPKSLIPQTGYWGEFKMRTCQLCCRSTPQVSNINLSCTPLIRLCV